MADTNTNPDTNTTREPRVPSLESILTADLKPQGGGTNDNPKPIGTTRGDPPERAAEQKPAER